MTFSTSTPTANHETVEQLIRYAASVFSANNVEYPPARMSKLIRKEHRSGRDVRTTIDTYVARALYKATWSGFELFTATGYADPTGARAVANIVRERGAL